MKGLRAVGGKRNEQKSLGVAAVDVDEVGLHKRPALGFGLISDDASGR